MKSLKNLLVLFLFVTIGYSQTTVNGGRTFTGPVDMTGASSTKPFKTGSSVPGSCSAIGEWFQLTTTAALYNCDGSSYVLFSTGGASTNCIVSDTGTTATLSTPCAVSATSVLDVTLSSNCVFTPTSGTGHAVFAFRNAGYHVYHDVAGTTSASCTVHSGSAVPPLDAKVLGSATITSGVTVDASTVSPISYLSLIDGDYITFSVDAAGNVKPNITLPTSSSSPSYQYWTYSNRFILFPGASLYGTGGTWVLEGTTGSDSMIDAVDNYGPGNTFTSGATSGDFRGARASNSFVGWLKFTDSSVDDFIEFSLRTTATITQERLINRFLGGGVPREVLDPTDAGAFGTFNAFGFIYDDGSNRGGTGSAANWKIQVCNALSGGGATACTYTDTGVAVATSTAYKLKLTKAASNWAWEIRSGSAMTVAGSGTITPTLPSTSLSPHMIVRATSAAARSFTAHEFGLFKKLR